MANQEHLDLLKQGVSIWNTWREKQGPDLQPDLRRADLSDADLRAADFIDADLRETNLRGTILNLANLGLADLRGADLRKAHLDGAILSDADLSGATLSGATLSFANLNRTYLIDADLSRTDISGANITLATLRGANLSDARVRWTIFGDLDLRMVKGLETLVHDAPSTIGTDTIERSQGDLPEAFLRGAGLSNAFITYARSLVQAPIKYYTCFISYSSKDQDFTERLHADLQGKGVRCWFAPEDLKIGEKFWHRIDESIRLYDKLLVVISQHSVESEWVEREVMAALEKERQQRKTVLFPITLDDAFKQTTAPWAADIRRSSHTGNFTQWKQHDDYQKAFDRLLQDLQADTQCK
jgi:hypothetical protein